MKSVKLTEIASNPKIIQEILGKEPDLKQIEVFQISYDRDGPKITIRFDLQEFPEVPPKKWQQQSFYRVQMQISLVGIRQAVHKGWATSNMAEMCIEIGRTGAKTLRLRGQTTDVEAVFDFLNIDKISAYKNGD